MVIFTAEYNNKYLRKTVLLLKKCSDVTKCIYHFKFQFILYVVCMCRYYVITFIVQVNITSAFIFTKKLPL